jgi:hypothetical protein
VQQHTLEEISRDVTKLRRLSDSLNFVVDHTAYRADQTGRLPIVTIKTGLGDHFTSSRLISYQNLSLGLVRSQHLKTCVVVVDNDSSESFKTIERGKKRTDQKNGGRREGLK